MNLITHHDQSFPNHYEVFSTPRGATNFYLSKILRKKSKPQVGIFFDKLKDKLCRKDFRTTSFFKMGEPTFAHKLNQTQIIRYGAALYLLAALILVPAGICSVQYQPLDFSYPIIVAAPFSYDHVNESMSVGIAVAEQNDAQVEEAVEPEETEPDLPFRDHILQASRTYQVDAALIRAIIMAESSNNPKAVSHRGAQGLMQLMPTTAKWLGVDDSFDPALNIDAGVRYFKRLLDRFDGNVQLALAAYNAGSRYVRKYGGVPPFRATRVYIKKVLNYHRLFKKASVSVEADLTTS